MAVTLLDSVIYSTINEFCKRNGITPDILETDERLENLNEKIKSWLEHVDSTDKEIFLKLLECFDYYHVKKIKECYKKQYEKFKNTEPSYEKSVYLPICSFGGVINGATHLMYVFQRANKINKKRVAIQPNEFSDKYKLQEIENIVLIDDIIGTGTTITGFLSRLKETSPKLLVNKKIYILSLVSMPKGIEVTKEYANNNNLSIEFIHEQELPKAFTGSRIFLKENEERAAKKIIKSYETNIAFREIDVLGYKRSEGLVAFEHNTPNNTLSIFWETEAKNNWNALFPREKGEDELPKEDQSNSLRSIKLDKDMKDKARYLMKKYQAIKRD